MPTFAGAMRRVQKLLQYGRYNHRSVFSRTFHERRWGDEESVSGIGSRLVQTGNIRRELPRIIRQFRVKRLFDAPCGDLNWIKQVLVETGVDYVGGDIVPEVVDLARQNSPNPKHVFLEFDITCENFPPADLWLCRDVLFHLSFKNIWNTLENFSRSGIDLILVTTHTAANITNYDIYDGDVRLLDLFSAPFSLPRSIVIDRFPDYEGSQPERDMVLMRRQDLAEFLRSRKEQASDGAD